MTESTQAANGQYTTDGRPNNASSLTPFLAIADAKGAVDFYRDVFGAEVRSVAELDGHVAHAVLDFGSGLLELGEPMPDFHLVGQPEGDDVSGSFGIYVPNCDEVVAKAEAAGATIREPLMTFVSGDRYASIRDPFGVRWSVMTRVEDLSPEESARRVEEWAAQQG